MTSLSQFLARCEAYGTATGLGRARVSTLVLNDGKRLQALHAGADMTTGRLERSNAKLAALEVAHTAKLAA